MRSAPAWATPTSLTRLVEETDVDAAMLAGRYTLLDQSALG